MGARLARALLERDGLCVGGSPRQPIDKLLLTDLVPPPEDLLADPKVEFFKGNLEEVLAQGVIRPAVGLVFHLAAAVSAECEANFDLGMSSNLQGTLGLLEACRSSGHCQTVVFASSVAVFGRRAGESWEGQSVDDDTLPTPQSSYGIQKFIGEQLMADYGRKGFIRPRSGSPTHR